jgi:hypothetical protein
MNINETPPTARQLSLARAAQASDALSDVRGATMENIAILSESDVRNAKERRRTVVAVFSASFISLMVWVLVVALHVR